MSFNERQIKHRSGVSQISHENVTLTDTDSDIELDTDIDKETDSDKQKEERVLNIISSYKFPSIDEQKRISKVAGSNGICGIAIFFKPSTNFARIHEYLCANSWLIRGWFRIKPQSKAEPEKLDKGRVQYQSAGRMLLPWIKRGMS